MSVYYHGISFSRRARGRRGAAAVEFVFCIPMMALILGLTFFFGWGMVNRLHVVSADQYSTWKRVYGSTPSDSFLNERFFDNKSDAVVGRGHDVSYYNTSSGTPYETLDEFISEAQNQGGAMAYDLADEMVHDFPWSISKSTAAKFSSEIGLWQRFCEDPICTRAAADGTVLHGHARDGVEWRNDDGPNCRNSIRERFLKDMDEALQAMPDPLGESSINPLAGNMRGLYNIDSGWQGDW